MAPPRTRLRPALLVAASAAFGLTMVGGLVRDAHADGVQIGKGVAGGALLGADAVTIVESLVGVHAGWAYGVGALVGAGGGGVGGYFLSKDSSDGKAPTYLLAGGLALVIPALVLYLNATRYTPEEGATEDRSPTAPAAEPGIPGGNVTGAPPDVAAPPPPPPPADAPPPRSNTPQAKARTRGGPGLSLVDVHEGALRLGLPVPDVRPVFSVADQRQYGMHGETELRLPVLHVTF